MIHGWEKKVVKYNNYGHKTRLGWEHPSKCFTQPISFNNAVNFQKRVNLYMEWRDKIL